MTKSVNPSYNRTKTIEYINDIKITISSDGSDDARVLCITKAFMNDCMDRVIKLVEKEIRRAALEPLNNEKCAE